MIKAKILHITIHDGDKKYIDQVTNEMNKLKEKELFKDVEFFITNEQITINNLGVVIKELINLYKKIKKDKKWKEKILDSSLIGDGAVEWRM